MKKVSLLAAAAAVAIVFSMPSSAQVSTQNPVARTVYTCTAKNARGKPFTARHVKLLSARSIALNACRNDAFFKGCRITGCIG